MDLCAPDPPGRFGCFGAAEHFVLSSRLQAAVRPSDSFRLPEPHRARSAPSLLTPIYARCAAPVRAGALCGMGCGIGGTSGMRVYKNIVKLGAHPSICRSCFMTGICGRRVREALLRESRGTFASVKWAFSAQPVRLLVRTLHLPEPAPRLLAHRARSAPVPLVGSRGKAPGQTSPCKQKKVSV